MIRAALSGGLDWKVLMDLAEEHSVQGLLARQLGAIGYEGVPVEVRNQLQARLRAQHLFTLSMSAELFRILEDFSNAKIGTMLVKGPLTSWLAYGDVATRSYVDLDLLVLHEDVLRATHRMLALGFELDVPVSVVEMGKIPGEYLFTRPGTQRMVELHTERSFRYYPKAMPLEELFARKRSIFLDGREVPALSLEDEFVLDCIHGAKHFWERLMWVSDIAAVVSRHPEMDWRKVRPAAQEVGAGRMLHVGLRIGAELLGLELPEAMAKEVQQDQASERLCRQIQTWLPFAGFAPPPLARRAKFRADMAGGGPTGVGYLLRLTLSPTEEDWKEGAEERRSWIWDSLRRPFRLIRKYSSGR